MTHRSNRSKGRTITLVRHGQTDGNVLNKAQGHYDAALTKRGHQQAKALARRLADIDFTAVYSSDSQRAMTTIKPLVELRPDLVVQSRPEIREIYYGDYENMPWDDIRDENPDFFWKWTDWNRRANLKFPNGECESDMWQRVCAFVDEILDTHDDPGEHILVVSHGGTIRSFVALLLGLPIEKQWRFVFDNASITVLKEHSFMPVRWQLYLVSDTPHIEDIDSDQ